MVPSATPNPKQAAWIAALQRATRDGVVVYRSGERTLGVANVIGGVWTGRPYTVAVTGERCCDMSCDCPAGRQHKLCKHAAAGAFALRHHVYARQPQAPAFDPSTDLPPSLLAARTGLR